MYVGLGVGGGIDGEVHVDVTSLLSSRDKLLLL